jgi:small-conductance mechanosensitive channel
MLMAENSDDVNELWHELIDIIQELKADVKDNRRAQRHLRNLEESVQAIGATLSRLASKKRGLLR